MARIKGSAMLNAVKFLRANKDLARELLPPPMRKYLDDRILVSNWYPEEDQLEIMRVMGRIIEKRVPDHGDDVYEFMGHFVAQADMSTVYANLIRPGDPESTLGRALLAWQVYHDTGTFYVSIEGPGKARLELTDYGCPSNEMCALLKGFHEQMIGMAGAKEIHTDHPKCRSRGDRLCVWEVHWKV